jgi:hypothetical protein
MSLSGFGIVGCKSTAADTISPASCPMEHIRNAAIGLTIRIEYSKTDANKRLPLSAVQAPCMQR